MTQEQKDFFNEVIHPKLISMAIDCTLPSDMTELFAEQFEEEAKAYNEANKRKVAIAKAGEFLFEDNDSKTIAEQVALIEATHKENLIDYIDGVELVHRFENTFTVETFLEQIGLI